MHPAMVWIRIVPQGMTRSVQLPASVKHRSVEGDCLLLSAGRSREITQDEWQHIQENHKDLLSSIERLGEPEHAPAAEPVAEPDSKA